MSRRQYLTTEDFIKLWEKYKHSYRYDFTGIDPALENMTVQGKSGPGTPFKNEYERIMDERRNPPMPVCITVVEGDGMIEYYREDIDNREVVDIIETELRKVNSGHYSYSSRQHARDIWRAIKDKV